MSKKKDKSTDEAWLKIFDLIDGPTHTRGNIEGALGDIECDYAARIMLGLMNNYQPPVKRYKKKNWEEFAKAVSVYASITFTPSTTRYDKIDPVMIYDVIMGYIKHDGNNRFNPPTKKQ